MSRRVKIIIASLGVLLFVLVPTLTMKTTPAAAATSIAGHVQCISGAGVEGVWIAANSGGSGWASWYTQGDPSVAGFSYSLPYGGSYYVHVGCGGSPSHWAVATYSYNAVTGGGHSFYCYDFLYEDPYYGHCTNT